MSEKVKRVLARDYTAEEMDRGEGMVLHPHSGRPLREYLYDPQQKQFHYIGGYRQRIGVGRDSTAGEPYPDHWVYDPFTGEALVEEGRIWLFCLNEKGAKPCLPLS